MPPKVSDCAKKAKNSTSKGTLRKGPKKSEGGKNKVGLATNIPLSVTLVRSRSYEKNIKTGSSFKKSEINDKSKSARSKSFSGRQRISYRDKEAEKEVEEDPEDTPIALLEKVAIHSKNKVVVPKSPKKSKTEQEVVAPTDDKVLPIWEKELKRIEDAWLNSVYCTLTTRANLLKHIAESFPGVEINQFHAEDKKLLQRFDSVKLSAKTETENLLKLVKSLLLSRDKTKEEYQALVKSDRELKKKIMIEDGPKKKDASESTEGDKTLRTVVPNQKKDVSFMSFFSFGNATPSQIEYAAKSNAEDSKEIISACNINAQDLEALKAKYSSENEFYEKKIKDLEILLEEKIKTLNQEKEVKNQLQACLSQFQAQQKRLGKTLGCEQLDELLGPSTETREKRREELWLTAIKLILKGFFIQLKNLEMEKNKMLFQLQSNDIENFNALAASIIQKDNFVKSIKQQMKSFNKAYQKRKNKENLDENEKN